MPYLSILSIFSHCWATAYFLTLPFPHNSIICYVGPVHSESSSSPHLRFGLPRCLSAFNVSHSVVLFAHFSSDIWQTCPTQSYLSVTALWAMSMALVFHPDEVNFDKRGQKPVYNFTSCSRQQTSNNKVMDKQAQAPS